MSVPSPEELEVQREELYAALAGVGDFRRGSVSENYRRCGKANCACARPEHPGHRPRYLWTRTVGGRSRGRQLAGVEVDKVRRELDRYAEFVTLTDRLVEVNEKICEARPVDAAGREVGGTAVSQGEKGAVERGPRAVRRRVGSAGRAGHRLDRRHGGRVGGGGAGGPYRDDPPGRRCAGRVAEPGQRIPGSTVDCGSGHAAVFVSYRDKTITTVLGPVTVHRAYYHCRTCGHRLAPRDGELGVAEVGLSPGLRAMAARTATAVPLPRTPACRPNWPASR